MNEEELSRALHDATAGITGPRAEFQDVAAAGRRRLQRRRLSGLAAGVGLLAATLGVVLANGDPPAQTVRAADGPNASDHGRSRRPQPPSPTTTTTVVHGGGGPTDIPPSTNPSVPGPTRATVLPTTPPTLPPNTATTVPPGTGPPGTKPPPSQPPRSRPVMRPAANGDVDGDGIGDRVSVAPIGNYRAEVRADLSTLGKQTVKIDLSGGAPVAVMGVSDVDGDGFADVFVRVGHGASVAQGSILRLVNDQLSLVHITGAGPTTPIFLLDGSVTGIYSFECVVESDWIVMTEAHPIDDTAAVYEVTYRSYRFQRAQLVLVDSRSERMAAARVPSGMQVECDLPQRW